MRYTAVVVPASQRYFVPGQWEFDRIAARRPEMYGPLTEGSVGS
jgi:hypothetical protein